MMKSIVHFLIASAFAQTATLAEPPPKPAEGTFQGGSEYLATLAEVVQASDKIEITEHSCPYDAFDRKAGRSLITDEIVYGTRDLSASQRELFLSIVKAMDPKTRQWDRLCLFESHHAIRFYSAGKLTSTMEICFKCSEVEWGATNARPPEVLLSSLARFVESIGFSPERDWRALAKKHLPAASR
jgi:hypothetical protein